MAPFILIAHLVEEVRTKKKIYEKRIQFVQVQSLTICRIGRGEELSQNSDQSIEISIYFTQILPETKAEEENDLNESSKANKNNWSLVLLSPLTSHLSQETAMQSSLKPPQIESKEKEIQGNQLPAKNRQYSWESREHWQDRIALFQW